MESIKAVGVRTDSAEVKSRALAPEDFEIPGWLTTWLDARQQKQVEFALVYANNFHHGADGHNNMMIIARLVEAIKAKTEVVEPKGFVEPNKG